MQTYAARRREKDDDVDGVVPDDGGAVRWAWWHSTGGSTRGTGSCTPTASCTGASTRGTTFLASGMSPHASVVFFSLCTAKGVDDHCGLWLPVNPLQRVFRNNAAYHDVHHQRRGGRYNFSQPFFVTWDKVFGTHMPYMVLGRPGGGLQARPVALPPALATPEATAVEK
ncbi:hypothetical protein E2562_000262 [Oryza meyeriana var. granulata]|uniref:aldehyde oxygenase (deformylating) n=1 Tax=Oryza meyeriana var. granulata TaxID=110450 RepID=A0A6G1CMS7_9ORYZ|nr:hypothetical protein E2562_000262 [Oryza meyeriana var. granulata]